MPDYLNQFIDYLISNDIFNYLNMLLVSFITLCIVFFRTRTTSLRKKLSKNILESIDFTNYFVIIQGKVYRFDDSDLIIKTKDTLTKLEYDNWSCKKK